jgi:uncharacterized protein
MEKKELTIAGITFISAQSQSYQLLMYNSDTDLSIPIVIGAYEAQSIAIEMEDMQPPRPLTHDLFPTIFNEFGINLEEVNIYRMDEGIFYSNLLFDNGSVIDCRTSDGISIALRLKVPVYVKSDILTKVGFVSEEVKNKTKRKPKVKKSDEEQLNDAIADENFELAAEIKSRMNKS